LTRSGTNPVDRLVLSGQAGTNHVTTNGGTVYVVTTAPVLLATGRGSVVATFAITNTGVLGSKVSPNLKDRSSEREGMRFTFQGRLWRYTSGQRKEASDRLACAC
jgi:hypothetical protein